MPEQSAQGLYRHCFVCTIFTCWCALGIVIVGHLLRRQPWASRPDFNEDVVKVNVLLKEDLDKIEGAHFWSHRGFWADLSYLGQDGVHIKEES